MDVAKGIAIISVVLSHNHGFPISMLSWLICPYYIALFFVISGYFDKGRLYFKRIEYFLACFIGYTVLLFGLSFIDKNNQYPYIDRFMRALYGRYCIFPIDRTENIYMQVIENHPMWFIPALISSTLLFWITTGYLKRIRTHLQFIVAVAVLFFVAASCIFCLCPILLPWSLDTVLSLTIFMIFGCGAKS